MGSSVPKQLLQLAGRPLLQYAVAAFDAAPGIDRVLVVMAPGFRAEAEEIVAAGSYRKVTDIFDGGVSRTASTRRALDALSSGTAEELDILLHDAARPLVDQRIIAECLAELRTSCAVTAAVPTADTILRVDGGTITDIPDRGGLLRCQTPQGFRLATLLRAYDLADADAGRSFQATDDCSVVLRYLPEVSIRVVPGSQRNIKVTEPADLAVAEALLRAPPAH